MLIVEGFVIRVRVLLRCYMHCVLVLPAWV